MTMLGVRPEECVVGAFGVRIKVKQRLTGYGRNLLISLAGPLANVVGFCILMLLRQTQSGVIHLLLAILNLLPAASLDGGEILRCGLCMMGLESFVPTVLRFTSALILLPLATVSFCLLFHGEENPTLLIVSVYLTAFVFFSEKYEKTS